MGCSDSKQDLPLPAIIKKKDALGLPSWLRAHVIESLRKSDYFLVHRIFKENTVSPGSGLYQDNPGWNCFHECCQKNSVETLEFLLDLASSIDANRMKLMINQKDKDGDTPAMVCCMNDAHQNLEFLLKRNLINTKETNQSGRNIEQLATEFSRRCLEVIKEHAFCNEKSITSDGISKKDIQSRSTQSTFRMAPNVQVQGTPTQKSEYKYDKMKHLLSQINENFKIYGILSEMDKGSEKFVDKEFSIDSNGIVDPNEINIEVSKLRWLRPHELYQGKCAFLKLFDRVAPEDINIEAVEDSSFALALQVLSEFPGKVMQTIINKEANIHGVYSCKFHVMGLAAEVCTDDLLPCDEEGQLLFTKSKRGEIWPMIMEKLAAKFYGSYQNTKDGLLDDIFEDLLGVPCANYDLKKCKKECLYDLMSTFAKLNFIAAASSLSEKTGSKGTSKIQDGYYIIDAYELNGTRFIKLRAPNGTFKGEKIQGKIAHGDKYFQPCIKEKAFVLKSDEFADLFDVVSVAFCHDSWHRNYINMTCASNHAEYVSLNVRTGTRIYIVVNQESARLSEDPDYRYSDVEILLAKETEKSFIKIASGDKGVFYPGKTFHIDQKKLIELEEGRYVIRVKLPSKDKEQREFTITTYSEEEVFLEYLPRENYKNFLELVYIEEGRKVADKYELGTHSFFVNSWDGNHLWLYIQNESSEKTWDLEIEFKKMENIKLMKRHRVEDMAFRCSLPPQSERVAILKRDEGQKSIIEWAFKNEWI